MVVDGSKVNLVFIFGPRLKLCSSDLDLDQAEQKSKYYSVLLELRLFKLGIVVGG